jgi:hypothetical protein
VGLTLLDIDEAPIPVAGGGVRERIVKLTFDASYPTGGESLTATDVGLTAINFVLPTPFAGYVFEYDYANAKLLAYYQDADAVADSALIQVPNTTDLAALVTAARLLIIGDA